MTKLARALVSSVLILGLLIGVPIVLVVVAGWPLPTKMPNWDNVYWAIRQGDVPAEAVIKLFACVAWLAWAQIAWALLWELVVNVPRLVRGEADRDAPLTPAPASKLARRLITAAMVLTAISSSPATTVAAPSLSSFGTTGAPPRLSTAPTTLVNDTADVARPQVDAAPTGWRAMAGDTLWDVAERCLGDGAEVDQVLRCNPGLDPARPLRAGQIVELPDGISAPADRAVAPPAAPGADVAAVEPPAPSIEAPVVSEHRHTVVTGENLWDIVEGYHGFVTVALVDQVAADSGIADPSLIYAGQVIVLRDLAPANVTPVDSAPVAAPVDASITSYRVVNGDTLWDIVDRHYGYVDADLVWAVAGFNNLETPSLIYADQQILLPPLEQLFPSVTTAVPPAPPAVEVPVEDAPSVADPQSVPTPPAVAVPVPPVESKPPTTVPTSSPTVVADDEPPTSTSPATAPASTTPSAPAEPAVTTPAAAPVEASDAVEHDDMLSSRWLFPGVAFTSLGLVGAWLTLKRKRRHRRRWLGVDPALVATAPTERERAAQDDVAMLHALVDPALLQAHGRAVLLGAHPEIWFRDTPPLPPEGWESVERGWRRTDGGASSVMPVLSPALVTIGQGIDGDVTEVLLDLLSAGTVSVTGHSVAVERLVCSMLWELASAPLGVAVDLHIVGLACVAARHTSNAGRSVSLDEAIEAAHAPLAGAQVFLVDPFAGDTSTGNIRDLISACAPGSGRSVVIAGPCEHPVEQLSVPSAQRVRWDDLTLAAPQLPETVDMELGRMLDATDVGRRTPAASAMTSIPDPEAEALALRSTITVVASGGDWSDPDDDDVDDDLPSNAGGDDSSMTEPVEAFVPLTVDEAIELPDVLLSVCGREVAIHGYPVPRVPAVLFVLAAAKRDVHSSELVEVTGYAAKSLSTVYTANHDLVERDNGTLRLAKHVWTDHAWATKCVGELAEAMQSDAGSAETDRWTAAAFEALHALEHAPYAVLPTRRDRTGSAWRWVDDFPADAPARSWAETEVAEAALAFSELWLAGPGPRRVVRADQLVAELSRLAATVPYARVVRQLRDSPWQSGAECLLSAAARVADGDETLLARVQQTARALAAREQLEASIELADELGL